MIHLDPSFLIAATRGGGEGRKLREWVKKNVEISMSAVGWMEFLCGPVSREQASLAARVVGAPVPFTAKDATRAAMLFNATGRRRGSTRDCMIAAAALNAAAQVATSNPDDFSRFDGLEVLTGW